MQNKPESAEFRKYLVEYNHEGARWCITVAATSFEDAGARLRQIYYGRVLGTVEAEIPAVVGSFIPNTVCWFRNILRQFQR